ncbi:SusD/RagB family nutrient-binding outer membrane lipoprotein, partial [bacterium]|nr:SusD/RagB family nutrient-binding outer membrane lipoprotein [bacterium]
PGAEDLVFGGDMDKWTSFANTLKLKIYMRYVNKDANKYKTQIQALLTANKFLTEDAKITSFKAEQTGYNPFYNTFVDRLTGNINANKNLMDSLNAHNDPRKAKIFTASATGANYNAITTGDSKNLSGKTIKDFATPTVANTAPVYFFTKEEVLFLIAEAQARYGTATAAEATFKSA